MAHLALASVLNASWERLGSILGASWSHLGPSWSRLGASCGRLGASCERLGAVLASQKPPKIAPRPLQDASQDELQHRSNIDLNLEASWVVLGRERWPTWLQVGPQIGTKIDFKSIFVPIWGPTWNHVSRLTRAKTAQDASKTPPRRLQDGPRGV